VSDRFWSWFRVAAPRVITVREYIAVVRAAASGKASAVPSGGALASVLARTVGAEAKAVAERIAKESGIRVVSVSLRGAARGYASETERSLDVVFASAERAGAMLCFSDADALFGRDNSASSTREVAAWLVKRLDASAGVVLFTFAAPPPTLDEAFLRRMQYIVALPAPDASRRDSLWRALLPG
jgi:SpoVK/Ycf46/Vps4 family AAA+-type ATPase